MAEMEREVMVMERKENKATQTRIEFQGLEFGA